MPVEPNLSATGVMTNPSTTDAILLTRMQFPYPDRLLSLNDRMHWSKRAKLTRSWRDAVAWRAIAHARNERLMLPLPSAVVVCRFFGARQRDAINLAATVKVCTDALVDAGWFLGDDDARVSQAEPLIVRGPLPVAAVGVCEILVYAR